MNILVPIDGSQNSLSALRHAIDLRSRFRETVVLHVINVQLPVASGAVKRFISEQQLNEYYQEEGTKALAAAREVLESAGIAYEVHIGVGDVAATIAAHARQKNCAHIVLGARGIGGFAGALLGSTATRVTQVADVPVTVVK